MDKNKNVLIVNTVPFVKNGVSQIIFNYYNLTYDEFNYDIVSNQYVDNVFLEKVKKNTLLFELPSRKKKVISYCIRFISLIKNKKYDIVHIHGNSSTMIIESLLCRVFSRKSQIIVHTHNTDSDFKKIGEVLKIPFNISYDIPIACGVEAGKALFNKQFTVLNNGVELNKYQFSKTKRENFRKNNGIGDDEIVIGHIGRFNNQKNHKFIIEIIKNICKTNKKVKCLLIGEGKLKEEIEAIVSENNLNEFIVFLGELADVSSFYSGIDTFILPSLFEGLPLVGVEAQASGVNTYFSDTIDPQILMSDNSFSKSINRVEDWEIILKNLNIDRNSQSQKNIKELTKEGYSIDHNVYQLKEIYNGK